MTKWILIGSTVLIAFIAWNFLRVGMLHGSPVFLNELTNANTRLLLRIQTASLALAEAINAPLPERLSKLLEVERTHGHIYQINEKIQQAIIGTGTDEATAHFKRILNTPRSGQLAVVFGIRDALKSGESGDHFTMQAFNLLIDGLNHEETFGVCSSNIPGLMLDLDAGRAIPLLRSTCEDEPAHYLISSIMDAFLQRDLPIPESATRRVLENDDLASMSGAEIRQKITAALSTSETDRPRAEKTLQQIMDECPSEELIAAEAMLQVRDLPHPRHLLSDLQEEVGFDALSDDEKTVWLADNGDYLLETDKLYDAEWSEEGNQLKEMHEAILKVGGVRAAAIIKSYMNLYGPDGPSPIMEERKRFVETMGDAWIEAFRDGVKLDEGWEEISLLAIRFELEHPDRIRKASEIRKILNRPDEPGLFNR